MTKPGARYDGVTFKKKDQVVTAASWWCQPLGCDIVRGIVGTTKLVHRDGDITVALRYRGKAIHWKSNPNKWLTFDEWKAAYPEDHKKWTAFQTQVRRAKKALKGLHETAPEGSAARV